MAAKRNAEIFAENCRLPEGAPDEVRFYAQEVARTHSQDFSAAHAGYFSLESQAAIARAAAQKFCEKLNGVHDRAGAHAAWAEVVKNFHADNYWGYKTQATPEKIVRPPSSFSIGAKYFFAFFNSVVVIKTAVLFIGAEAAENPDPKYTYWLWAAIAFSFLNLFWFAYSAIRKERAHKHH